MSSFHTKLKAQARAKAGKGAARAIRREACVPAVIYGDHKEPVLITLTEKDMKKALEKKTFYTHLCDLDVDGTRHLVLPRDVQFHPVTDRPVHVDFLRVTERTVIRVSVPVRTVNEDDCPGLTKGGVLNLVKHDVEVYCPATAIPEEFVVDLAGIEIGQSVHVEDLKLGKNIEPAQQGNFTILTIVAPTTAEAEDTAAAEGEAGAEGGQPAAEGGESDKKDEGK